MTDNFDSLHETDTGPSETPGEPGAAPVDATTPRKLRRNINDKVIAGVARGLGDRFDVDANIFRVLFVVVSLFWGLGVAIYLALWVFLPRAEGVDTSLSRQPRPPTSTSRRLSVAVIAGVVVVVAVLGLLALGATASHVGPSLTLLWIVFLVALAIVALRTPAKRLTLRRMFALLFLTGLSFLIILLGVFIGFLDSTGVSLSGGNGVHVWQPTALGEVQRVYTTEFGSCTLDLSAVVFPASGTTVTASTAAGDLQVTVPADAVVSVSTHVGIGSVHYLQGSTYVPTFVNVPSSDVTAQQRQRAPHLFLDARVGIGQITIVRAINPAAQ